MPQTASKKQFLAVLAKYPGATYEIDRRGDITVDAPPGQVFVGTDTHAVVAAAYCNVIRCPSTRVPRGEQYAMLIEDMEDGFTPCPDPDCEYCYGED